MNIHKSRARVTLSDTNEVLCFLAGANSIFVGKRLLMTSNHGADRNANLFDKLGLSPMETLQ